MSWKLKRVNVTLGEPDEYLEPNSIVIGYVNFELVKPLCVQSIRVRFLGEEIARKGHAKNEGEIPHSIPRCAKYTIFDEESLIWGQDQFEGPFELDEGEHSIPFTVTMPAVNYPPTSSFDSFGSGTITYKLKAIFDLPGLPNWIETKSKKQTGVVKFRPAVCGPRSQPYVWDDRILQESSNVKEAVLLEARMPKSTFSPGEDLLLELQLKNQSTSSICGLRYELQRKSHLKFSIAHKEDTYMTTSIRSMTDRETMEFRLQPSQSTTVLVRLCIPDTDRVMQSPTFQSAFYTTLYQLGFQVGFRGTLSPITTWRSWSIPIFLGNVSQDRYAHFVNVYHYTQALHMPQGLPKPVISRCTGDNAMTDATMFCPPPYQASSTPMTPPRSERAKGLALVKLVQDALAAPGVFVFAELLAQPSIIEAQSDPQVQPHLTLLRIFSYGTFQAYKGNASQLPELTEPQATKLKQLSILTLASQQSTIPYQVLLNYLEIAKVRQLEDLIIDAMYQGLLKGKLDQQKHRLEVEYTIGRDLRPGQLDEMCNILQQWTATSQTTLATIDSKMASVNDAFARNLAEKENYAKEVERLKTAIKVTKSTMAANLDPEMLMADRNGVDRGGDEDLFEQYVEEDISRATKLKRGAKRHFASRSMGIHGLNKLIADNASNAIKSNEIKSYFGRKVAIDASMSIYQFMIAVRQQDGQMLTNEFGETTSHLMGMFYRTIRMVDNGIKPAYVFDGRPPTLKSGELAIRADRRREAKTKLEDVKETGTNEEIDRFSRRTVRVTKEHNDECKRLLKLMGIPYVEAPCEAEAQCAALAKAGKVYAAASEDMDTLTFASPILLRHLTFSEQRKMPIDEVHLDKALAGLDIDMDQFIDLSILLGCDYVENIKGVGPARAIQMIREYKCLEKIIPALPEKLREAVPADWKYAEARELFKNPEVANPDEIELKWEEPDMEGLVKFLVQEKGFNEERVRRAAEKLHKNVKTATQGRLDGFFTVLPSSPSKRKVDDKAKAADKKAKPNAKGAGRGKPRK
ncbi:hypothetical protein BZG36_04209 [Bifiguratus adelaidae]|uniref:Flap endonuclease 1 n=1 Tax=Bifiguratus adelaidae TaxID=1938954 RepID=A0A261XYB5_9FUNG|nr:hypothetical protein BZG36_04209 [Bifiguratus adelaidae]